MLLKQMIYFKTVKECNSFTIAAEKLFISQSAISQQIKLLENELGVELIYRKNREFRLTLAGEYFYRHCTLILNDINRVCRETARIGTDEESILRIGYLTSCSSIELQRAISDFSKTYPEVDINIVNGTHEELYDYVRNGDVDLVLSDQRRAFSNEYVNYELIDSNFYIEISANNELSNNTFVTFEQLKDLPCILISSREQQEIEQNYYQNTLGFYNNFIFANNLEEARLIVSCNKGFLPMGVMGATNNEYRYIKKVYIYKNNRPLQRKFCAFWLKKNSGYYVEEFVDTLYKLLNN